MINGPLLHPDVLAALARSGHTGKIMIADGQFPISTGIPASVPRAFLNYAPNLLTVPQALGPLVGATPIESVAATINDDGSLPSIWDDYRAVLAPELPLSGVKASEFGPLLHDPALALVIATGDLRSNACIVLTLGRRTH
jgi:L-fucose mutarotase